MPPLVPQALSELSEDQLLINETFLSIQGESSHAGRLCFFIRLTGCHLRCSWCDSEYAFHEGVVQAVDDCIEDARKAGVRLVEITGGEPLLQKGVYPLMSRLCDEDFEVLLETSGALAIDRVDPRVKRIVDWKTPGSGEAKRNHPKILEALAPGDELKLVISDRVDYEWARDWLRSATVNHPKLGTQVPVHVSPVHGRCSNLDLARWIIDDRLPVRFNLQLHKYVWPPSTRGV